MDAIYQRLSNVLRDVFDDDTMVATDTLSAAEIPEWDSIAHVRFILAVEREFRVKFTAAEIASLKNVGDLAKAVVAKTG
jgi:acyl carrier protein